MNVRLHQTGTARTLANGVTENEAAVRALFAAASRVLSYRAAALDAKLARASLSRGPSATDVRVEATSCATHA